MQSTHHKHDICCSVWKISIIKDRYRLAEDIIRNQFDLIMIVIEERTTAAVILTIRVYDSGQNSVLRPARLAKITFERIRKNKGWYLLTT